MQVKRIILALLFFVIPAFCSWSTPTISTTTASGSCGTGSTTNCTATVTSTGAHHLLVQVFTLNNATVSGVTTSSACNATWTHATNTAQTEGASLSTDIWYCTDSVASVTSIVSTTASTGKFRSVQVYEFPYTGTSIAYDSSNGNVPSSGTALAGPSVSNAGTNDVWIFVGFSTQTINSVTSPTYTLTTMQSTQARGGYFKNSGLGSAPTINLSVSGTGAFSLVAFTETYSTTNSLARHKRLVK